MQRALDLASDKGASSWLTTLPLEQHGFSLNKREFRDALCLRYAWKIKISPSYCACGAVNDINHLLICKRGGYVTLRHDELRNTGAELLKEVCHDVKVEPELIPLTTEDLGVQANQADGARLDISARGLWSPMERTFFDVRVTHPNAPSNRQKPLAQIYREHEKQKKTAYNRRILEVEKSTFVPLVFTTSGGMAKECAAFTKRLAEKISEKRQEKYCDTMACIRKRLRFCILRGTLIALRGYRGRKSSDKTIPINAVDFSLVPGIRSNDIEE